MEKDKFNDNPTDPSPILPKSSDAQSFNSQPNILNAQNEPFVHSTVTSSNPLERPTNSSSKTKKIMAILASSIAIAVIVILVLFLTGIIGEHRIEIGNYTIVVDENKWNSSIGQDGNTLVLIDKENAISSIGLLPYENDITYELIDQKDSMKALINQMENVQFENQSSQTISNTRCIVVNIRYKKAIYANDEAIKAFCESKDGTIFLIEVEGANQTELKSNLALGVDIINTARHK